MTSLATALPENTNDGYVAAAYIVFFAIVLIYVAIMAVRLGRVERKIEQLRGDAKNDAPPARAGDTDISRDTTARPDRPAAQEHTLKGAGERV